VLKTRRSFCFAGEGAGRCVEDLWKKLERSCLLRTGRQQRDKEKLCTVQCLSDAEEGAIGVGSQSHSPPINPLS